MYVTSPSVLLVMRAGHLVISIKLRFSIAFDTEAAFSIPFDTSSCVFRYLAGSYVLAALVKTGQSALTGGFCRTERDNSFCPNWLFFESSVRLFVSSPQFGRIDAFRPASFNKW